MENTWIALLPLIIGFSLDGLFGDPRFIPHPIVLFGNAISFFEKKYNAGKKRKIKGALISTTLITGSFLLFSPLYYLAQQNTILYISIASFFAFQALANHGLIKEALAVSNTLEQKGIEQGRLRLSYIVGRDTSKLSPQQVRTAVLETVAENLSDAVIAPMFYYLVGGVPAMFAYKMINTLDSMIGYKNSRYKDFGFFAAKIDDIFNYIPARITAFLMVIATLSKRGFIFIFKYGHKHSSPNAGYPESALAGILNCRFGGPNTYQGKWIDKPHIGNNNRTVTAADIKKACAINAGASILFLAIIIFLHHQLINC